MPAVRFGGGGGVASHLFGCLCTSRRLCGSLLAYYRHYGQSITSPLICSKRGKEDGNQTAVVQIDRNFLPGAVAEIASQIKFRAGRAPNGDAVRVARKVGSTRSLHRTELAVCIAVTYSLLAIHLYAAHCRQTANMASLLIGPPTDEHGNVKKIPKVAVYVAGAAVSSASPLCRSLSLSLSSRLAHEYACRNLPVYHCDHTGCIVTG